MVQNREMGYTVLEEKKKTKSKCILEVSAKKRVVIAILWGVPMEKWKEEITKRLVLFL